MKADTKRELRRWVEAYDRCWLEGRIEDLREALHPDVVFVGPRWERLAAGARACAKSYADFLARAEVHGFRTTDTLVDVADAVAVVTYRWAIDYEMAGTRHVDRGRELLVLARSRRRWRLVWRRQQPDAAARPVHSSRVQKLR